MVADLGAAMSMPDSGCVTANKEVTKSNCSHTCRVATPKAMKIVEAICEGEGRGSVEPV